MVLALGTQIGPYEILSSAGGKGEVYRTRDTKLDRDVAIKVLLTPFQRVHDSRRGTLSRSPELASARTTCLPLLGQAAMSAGDHRRRADAAVRGTAA
jgi:serine/threonine protein kinase